MFKWLQNQRKYKHYKNDVLAQIMAMTLTFDDEAAHTIQNDPTTLDSINEHFDEQIPAMQSAVFIVGKLLAFAIESNLDGDRKEILVQELYNWSTADIEIQRQVLSVYSNGELPQDVFLIRCQIALIMGQDLLLEKKIDSHTFRILKDSIFGPLKGESLEYRRYMRTEELIDKVLDE